MNRNLKSIVLFVAVIAVAIAAGSVFAAAVVPGEPTVLATSDAISCADLRLDEQYACRFGGWQPTPAPEVTTPVASVECDNLRLDEYYACRAAGWQPAANDPVHSR